MSDCCGERRQRIFAFCALLVACLTLYLFLEGDLLVVREWSGSRRLVFNVTAPPEALLTSERPLPSILSNSETLKYVTYGKKINCHQKPLSEDEEDLVPLSEVKGKRFAYSWYVASNAYLCSALSAMRMLKSVRGNSSLPYSVDYVLTYVSQDLKSELSKSLLDLWEEEGGVLKTFDSLKHLVKNSYYKASLQKFRAFQLFEYSRVVAMDADGMPLQDLDHLFRLKLPDGIHLASPQLYWGPALFAPAPGNTSGHKCDKEFVPITSVMIVVDPDKELYSRATAHFNTLRPNKKEMFDMDIINSEFACNEDMLVLPKHYGTLDSEFSQKAPLQRNVSQCQDLSHVQYMHFTSGGKPWTRKMRLNKGFYKSNYDKEVRGVFKQWFDLASSACPKIVPPFPDID